jgi:CRISPR-associated protein Csm1
MTNRSDLHQITLQVLQHAIASLLGGKLPDECKLSDETEIVKRVKKLLALTNQKIDTLSLLFDRIKLPEGKGQINNHYVDLQEITCKSSEYPDLPYPINQKPSQTQLESYQSRIADEINIHLNCDRWNDLNFLSFILEKYGSSISYGDTHVALVDAAKMTAAVATSLAQNSEANLETVYLIAGSLSGIQKFIYTISSDGALKSLRARSFYLELVAEEIVQQILEQLQLPRTNVIYAGGGNLFILTGESEALLKPKLATLQNKLNQWLEKDFQSKIFFSLDYGSCDLNDIKPALFRDCWNHAIAKVSQHKKQKFRHQVENGTLLAVRESFQPCKVCHRDDTEDLEPLKRNEIDSPLACKTCRDMFQLGDEIPDTLAILRTKRSPAETKLGAKYWIEINGSYYYLFENSQKVIFSVNPDTDTVYCINNWKIENYTTGLTVPMLMGRYYQSTEDGKFISAEALAEVAQGINRVGYLRMDVDRLGQIFAKGLEEHHYSLPRVASLSRQMSYFFKVYLNSLACDRLNNLTSQAVKLTQSDRPNLMFIYAGGDDLFISGAWNEVVEFAFDVYQSFRAYTGHHPDITISGGVSINDAKFPLYQSANSSGEAEDKAKDNGRDSLGLFGKAFKWDEWMGIHPEQIIKAVKERDGQDKYWQQEKNIPVLAGVLPFVNILTSAGFGSGYSRAFVRNILKAAQLQEQKLDDLRRKYKSLDSDEARDLRYYLHLPQIAYTISRLPKEVKLSDDFRRSLMSPYNAPYFRAIATWIELLNRG